MATSKRKSQEAQEAKDELRKILKPGDTVYTVLRHASRSGMQRVIDLRVLAADADGKPWLRWIGHLVSTATGINWTDKYGGGLVVGGCGMDMGFHLVYNLGYALWPAGYGCPGDGCRSNDHSNGDRDYTPHPDLVPAEKDHDCIICGAPATTCDLAADDEYGFFCDEHPPTRDHWHRDGGYALRQEWV